MKYLKSIIKSILGIFYIKIEISRRLKATTEEQLTGYEAVIVVYNDETAKHFTIQSWLIFREGIIENLYKKRLCKVYFVTKIVFQADQSNK